VAGRVRLQQGGCDETSARERASAANPKFASYRGGHGCELRVQKRHQSHSVSSVLFDSDDARRIREEFDPKVMLIPDRGLGIAQLVPDAMKFKFIAQPLTEEQLKELVQIPQ
jgi:hypothetical protein